MCASECGGPRERQGRSMAFSLSDPGASVAAPCRKRTGATPCRNQHGRRKHQGTMRRAHSLRQLCRLCDAHGAGDLAHNKRRRGSCSAERNVRGAIAGGVTERANRDSKTAEEQRCHPAQSERQRAPSAVSEPAVHRRERTERAKWQCARCKAQGASGASDDTRWGSIIHR